MSARPRWQMFRELGTPSVVRSLISGRARIGSSSVPACSDHEHQGGVVVATSTTRPSAGTRYEGMLAYETDTDFARFFDGTNWARLAGTLDSWATYSPGTFPATAHSGITVGNGTQTARYTRVGDWVLMTWELVLGSTSTFATTAGGIGVAMPFPADLVGTIFPGHISCVARDDTATLDHPGTGIIATGSVVRPRIPIVAGGYRVQLRRAAAQTGITTAGTITSISWDTEDYDALGMITVSSSVITIPADGTYLCSAFLGTTGRSDFEQGSLQIRLNGARYLARSRDDEPNNAASSGYLFNATGVADLVQGDQLVVEVQILATDTAATVSTATGDNEARFTVTRIGPGTETARQCAVGDSDPFEWATGDILAVSCLYKAAA